ncbi:MAG: acylphosphatase [Candidatus Bipolaricaulia bacterium]
MEERSNKRVHVWISGRVQGVFFRAHTRDRARSLGVVGWVRNLADGRVEAVFEGETEAVQGIVRWCHRGSPHARVRDVEIDWEPYRGEFRRFRVRY